MEPLSISASLTALLGLSASVIKYVRSIKGASSERQCLLRELSHLRGILSTLQEHADDISEGDDDAQWASTARCLSANDGPIKQFRELLEMLLTKLETTGRTKKIIGAIAWPFVRDEVNQILESLERFKTYFALSLEQDHIALSKCIRKEVSDIRGLLVDLQSSTERDDKRSRAKEFLAILEWLSPISVWTQWQDIFSRRHDQTGSWFWSTPECQQWQSIRGKILYCPRIPGAGKTVMSSSVVDHLRNTEPKTTAVICHFCSYKDSNSQDLCGTIGSIIRQLLQGQDKAPKAVEDAYEASKTNGLRLTIDGMATLIAELLPWYTRVFIVVDGLDEIGELSRIKPYYNYLFERFVSYGVNIMFTSRPILGIQQLVRFDYRLEIRATHDNIQDYLNSRMKEMHGCLRKKQELQERAVNEISKAADGMFLLATLHCDSLMDKLTARAVREALANITRSGQALEVAYDGVMARIQDQSPGFEEIAMRVLSWIVHAKKRLSLAELQHAIAIEDDPESFDVEALLEPSELVAYCAGLVVVDSSDTVHLVHYTAQEYLESRANELFPNAHIGVCRICLAFLRLHAGDSSATVWQAKAQLETLPFLNYAVRCWAEHPKANQQEILAEATEFLADSSRLPWIEMALSEGNGLWRSRPHDLEPQPYEQLGLWNTSSLHLCISYGLETVLRRFLLEGANVNFQDFWGETPLFLAAYKGNTCMVKILLEHDGIDINTKNTNGSTAILEAASKGHSETVQLLLQREDIDLCCHAVSSKTPLSCAASEGHSSIVRLLLDHGKLNLNYRDDWGWTAVYSAAWFGHVGVLKELLREDGVDVNLADNRGVLPFFAAAEGGHEEAVRVLLEWRGTNIAARDSNGRNVLHYCAENGQSGVLKQLLRVRGLDVNAADQEGLTPLLYAVMRGSDETVRVLLEWPDVDLAAQGRHGGTALYFCVNRGFHRITDLLLADGRTDPNIPSYGNWYPVHGSVQSIATNWPRATEGLQSLKKCEKVDFNRKGPLEATALCLAAKEDIPVKYYLDTEGVDVNAGDRNNRTPLHFAVETANDSNVEELLAEGNIDVNVKDINGFTPLWSAVTREYHFAVNRLLQREDIDLGISDEEVLVIQDCLLSRRRRAKFFELLKYSLVRRLRGIAL